jgi:hypothetical protein
LFYSINKRAIGLVFFNTVRPDRPGFTGKLCANQQGDIAAALLAWLKNCPSRYSGIKTTELPQGRLPWAAARPISSFSLVIVESSRL